jgi:hypothetical protein
MGPLVANAAAEQRESLEADAGVDGGLAVTIAWTVGTRAGKASKAPSAVTVQAVLAGDGGLGVVQGGELARGQAPFRLEFQVAQTRPGG